MRLLSRSPTSSSPALRAFLLALAPALGFALSHCGEDAAPPTGATGASGTGGAAGAAIGDPSASATTTGSTDQPPPAPGKGCTSAAIATPFDVDPEGPDTQIHAYGVVAEDGVWVAYNRPKPGGNFDVYVTKLGCDGKTVVAPVRVSDSVDNEIDAALSWDGEKLLVAWSADMSASGKNPNLETRLRLLSAAGEPLGPVVAFAPRRKGAPLVGNVWMPALAKAPSGYTLVGTWGHDEAPGFQAYAQALDEGGAPVGEGTDLDLAPERSQDAPSVVHDAQGSRVVVYASIANDSPDAQVPDIFVAAGEPPTKATLVEGGGRAIASNGPSGVWIAYQNGVTLLGSGKLTTRKGLLQPAIAAADVGAGVVAYSQAANKSPLKAYRVGADGALVGTTGLEISTGAAAYPLHLEYVGGDVFFVAYQEGSGQQIRAKARFVTIPK